MELVEGQPLSEVVRATLERQEWFPTAAVAQIALEIGTRSTRCTRSG